MSLGSKNKPYEPGESRFVHELLLDYVAMTDRFGPLDFDQFIELSREAEAVARVAVALGLAVEDVR